MTDGLEGHVSEIHPVPMDKSWKEKGCVVMHPGSHLCKEGFPEASEQRVDSERPGRWEEAQVMGKASREGSGAVAPVRMFAVKVDR